MPTESVILRMRDGTEAAADGDVTRYSSTRRMVTGGVVFGGFLIAGLATIPWPGVHLIAPWFLPLIGAGVALYLSRVAVKVGTVTGDCPSCSKGMTIDEGGTLGNDPLWLRCPHCRTPMEFRLRETPGEGE